MEVLEDGAAACIEKGRNTKRIPGRTNPTDTNRRLYKDGAGTVVSSREETG